MKIFKNNWSTSAAPEVSIKDAVMGSLEDRDNTPGSRVLEDMQRNLDRCTEALGVIVESLHKGGHLNTETLKQLLSYDYEIVVEKEDLIG